MYMYIVSLLSVVCRYSALCPDEVSRIWEVSKDHLNQQQDAHRKLMERSGQTTADGDSFMQQQTGSGQRKELGVLATQAQTKEEERKM